MTTWSALRIDYHVGDLGPLLMEAIRPAINEGGEGQTIFARPHWRRGQHVTIGVKDGGAPCGGGFLALCTERVGAWLHAHPAPDLADREAFLQECQAMAVAERDPRPLFPLAQNNSLSVGALDRPAPMGLAALSEPRDRFHAEVQNACFDLTELRLRNRGSFLTAAACALACMATAVRGSRYAFWPVSLLAHADGYLLLNPQMKPAFEQAAGRLGPPIASQLRRLHLVGQAAPQEDRGKIFSPWVRALSALESRLAPIIAAERLRLGAHDPYSTGDFPPLDPEKIDLIRNSKVNSSSTPLEERISMTNAIVQTEEHLTYRLMINLVYGALPSTGLSSVERSCLCYILVDVYRKEFADAWQQAETAMRALGRRALDGDVS